MGEGPKVESANQQIELQSPIPNPQSPIPLPTPGCYVLLGGLVGFLLSLPLGMLSAAPPGVAPVLLGLPLAAATIAVLLGWIREGQLPRWLPAVGVAVLLIDLSAAGGIGFPGVAGTFWLLLALGLQHEPPRAHGAVGRLDHAGRRRCLGSGVL